MQTIESTLSSKLKKYEVNPYNQSNKPLYTFFIQLPNSQVVYKSQLQLQPLTLVEDALLLAIEDFNHQLINQGKNLVKKIDFYVPRLPKKNGKAKTDMPCLDIHQKLIDIKITSVAIQIKDPDNAIVYKALQHQQFKTKRTDTKSTILVQMTQNSQKGSKKYRQQIEDENEMIKGQGKNECFCSFC